MEKIISIIIPAYNAESYIQKCIKSITCQTYKNLEIIIIDDGSTDTTFDICKSLADKDNRIILVSQPNLGVSSARNKGIELAKGDYIGFVDADDWIEEDMYEILYNSLIKENADISICGYVYEDIYGNTIRKSVEQQKSYRLNSKKAIEMMFDDRYYQGFLVNKLFCSKLFKTKNGLKNLLDTDISMGEDRLTVFRCMLESNNIVYIPCIKYHYLLNRSGAVNSNFSKKKLSGFKVYDYIFRQLPEDYKQLISIINCAFTTYNISLLGQIIESKYKDKELVNKLRKNIRSNIICYINSKGVTNKHKILAIAIMINPSILKMKSKLISIKSKFILRRSKNYK